MAKTDELLTTIRMTCPNCHRISAVEFHRELLTLPIPFLRLKKAGGFTCKCSSCGKTFKYSNPDKLYRYMYTSGEAFQRSFFINNLVTLAIPVVVAIAIIAIASVIMQIAAPILSPAHTGLPVAGNLSDNTPTPLKLYDYGADVANQTYYVSFQLSDNRTPVDMEALNVSIWKNGMITNTKIWRYGNSSIRWINTSHVGSIMGSGDKAQVFLNMSRYQFNTTDKVELLFQIFDHTPYVHPYTPGNRTTSPNGTVAVNSSGMNGTAKVTISGHVYLNNFTSPGITLTFNDTNKAHSVIVDNAGHYSISLLPNIPYTIQASDPDLGVLMSDTRTFTNNSTADFRLHT